MRIGADVIVILKDGLKKQVRTDIGGVVELDRLFGAEKRKAGSDANDAVRIGDPGIDEGERDSVLRARGEWAVIASAYSGLGVLSIGLRRAPVPTGKKIETLRGTGRCAEDGLIGHAVKEIISGRFDSLCI